MQDRYAGRQHVARSPWGRLTQRQRQARIVEMERQAADARRVKMCGTKLVYNRAQARSTAACLAKRSGAVIVPYKCPHCHRWHVGEDRLATYRKHYDARDEEHA